MADHGMLDVSDKLRDFIRGFNQMGGLTEFIDVGYGKERVDKQLVGTICY